jgi:hypothetical protein
MSRLVRRLALALIALIALAVPLVAGAQDRGGCQLLTASNGIYTIYAWDDHDQAFCDVGAYGVLTGPDHPAGPDLDLLQEGELPDTSFNTVHSYTTNSSYVLSDGSTFPIAARGGLLTSLSGIGEATLVDEQTIEISYDLNDLDLPDDFIITLTLQVTGTTIEDSEVQVLTEVLEPDIDEASRGNGGAYIGIRYLWDHAVNTFQGLDAGPVFAGLPALDFYLSEVSLQDGDLPDEYWMLPDLGNGEYFTIASGLVDPAGSSTPPYRIDYVCAPAAAAADFIYDLEGLFLVGEDTDCSPDPTGDAAVAYYWGQPPPDATRGTDTIFLEPGESFTAGASLSSFFGEASDPTLCLTLELDATQVAAQALGIPGLQNNDVACSETAIDSDAEPTLSRGNGPDPFELLFDGSDVGITRTIIDGLDIQEELSLPAVQRGEPSEEPSDILLSFSVAHSIPPIGLVLQADIVRFVAEQNGPDTAGQFERFFDGSDIGLESAGEDIDAFVFKPYSFAERGKVALLGDLFFSTKGNLNIPGLQARDEDIVVCWGYGFELQATGDIESSCEEIELFFDGSEAGLANASEDVDAFAFLIPSITAARGNGFYPDIYLSTRGNFNVNDVTGRNEDVFRCTPALEDMAGRGIPLPISNCENVEVVFDGSQFGLGTNNVFSIDLLAPPISDPCSARGECLARQE